MSDLLRPAFVTSPHNYLTRMVAVGVGCGLLGAVITLVANPVPKTVAQVPPMVDVQSVEQVRVADSDRAMEVPAAIPSRADELMLVFRVGGATYMKLADLDADPDAEAPLPAHRKLRLFENDETSAIGVVRDADVPAVHRVWKGRRVVVDGSCTANVTGFAIVARLVGDTGYAGIESNQWNAEGVLATGNIVLAARIEGKIDGCAKGVYARDAALTAVIVPTTIKDENLANAARSALLASDAAADAAKEWAGHELQGTWDEHTTLVTEVLRHPKTGVTWITVHGHPEADGCGGPDINLWGLFRVEPDGMLTTVESRKLDDIYSVEQVIDVDGDGELEIIGRPWLGLDVILAHGNGEPIDRLTLPFFGCPC